MTDSLLSRLQSATGPSPELDKEIALASGWENGRAVEYGENEYDWWSPDRVAYPIPPPYTESLDAALTLVPEGLAWTVCSYENIYKAKVWPDVHEIYQATAATPAIALVIACLKARGENKL